MDAHGSLPDSIDKNSNKKKLGGKNLKHSRTSKKACAWEIKQFSPSQCRNKDLRTRDVKTSLAPDNVWHLCEEKMLLTNQLKDVESWAGKGNISEANLDFVKKAGCLAQGLNHRWSK